MPRVPRAAAVRRVCETSLLVLRVHLRGPTLFHDLRVGVVLAEIPLDLSDLLDTMDRLDLFLPLFVCVVALQLGRIVILHCVARFCELRGLMIGDDSRPCLWHPRGPAWLH